jgi:hypothetical protein
LEFGGEHGMIRKRKLYCLQEHDQCLSLLAINNLNDRALIRNDGLLPTVQSDNSRHEMPLVRAILQPINILEHILALLANSTNTSAGIAVSERADLAGRSVSDKNLGCMSTTNYSTN